MGRLASRAAGGDHDRVVVGVNDSGLRRDRLDDLVQVRPGGNAGTDVEKLAMPACARYLAVRTRKARFWTAAAGVCGNAAWICAAAWRSAGKLSFPPRK
jgi:hypothetical protein